MKYLFLFLLISLFTSCGIIQNSFFGPVGFKYKYTGEYTGIDTLININGCYTAIEPLIYPVKGKPYESFHSFQIFDNGLAYNQQAGIWGTYIIRNDTIDIQFVFIQNWLDGCTMYKDQYKIISKNTLATIMYSNNKNVTNKDDFSNHVLKGCNKRVEASDCPLLSKKWFRKK